MSKNRAAPPGDKPPQKTKTLSYFQLELAMREAEQARDLYPGDDRPRMLATILEALGRALHDEDVKPIKKMYRLACDLLRVEPMRFVDWDAFEAWIFEQTRRVVAEGIQLPELATELRRALIARAPFAAARDDSILEGWQMSDRLFVDDHGRALNDDAVILELLISAMRSSCVGIGVRKDPFRYWKDKLGLRTSHLTKSGK